MSSMNLIKENKKFIEAVADHNIYDVIKILKIDECKFTKNLINKDTNILTSDMLLWKHVHKTIGSNNKPLLNAISQIEKKMKEYTFDLNKNLSVCVLKRLIISDMCENSKQDNLTGTIFPHNHLRNLIDCALDRQQFKHLEGFIQDMKTVGKKTGCNEIKELVECMQKCVKNNIHIETEIRFHKYKDYLLVWQGPFERGEIKKTLTNVFEFHQSYYTGPKVEFSDISINKVKNCIREKMALVVIKRQKILISFYKDLINAEKER